MANPFLIPILWVLATTAHGDAPELRTVPTLDLNAYLGSWHEIRRIPNRFEKGCIEAQAEYSRGEETDTLTVVNSCVTAEGKLKRTEGKAWIKDTGKFDVGFFKVAGWYPGFARGKYWVLETGPLDAKGLYSYAVVGEPDREYGWILAREPALSEETLAGVLGRLEAQGYSRGSFVEPRTGK